MTDREKLVELLDIIIQPGQKTLGEIADHLISHGVTVLKTPDMTGKCGSCFYAKPIVAFGGSRCYVSCTHPERVFKRASQHIRQRTCPACKMYKPTEEERKAAEWE